MRRRPMRRRAPAGWGRRRRMTGISPFVRNLVILAAIAGALTAIGDVAGNVLNLIFAVANVAVLVAMIYFGYTIWRQNRGTFSLMSGKLRFLLYGSVAALLLVILSSFWWVTSFITAIVFFVLLATLGYVIYRVWEESRRYYY